MKTLNQKSKMVLALALTGMLAIGPAMAEKPSSAGNGNSDKGGHSKGNSNKGGNNKDERPDGNNKSSNNGNNKSSHDGGRREHFDGNHRTAVNEYYGQQFRSGRCPPGLAKKHNGCMPPGQAKKWTIGHQLPRDVIYYSVPQELVIQIGQPPSGYRYVRVASDILMIAIGTGMIVDAIQDLGRS